MSQRKMTSRHEHIDALGNAYRIELHTENHLAVADGGGLADIYLSLMRALFADRGDQDPLKLLCDHEWRGGEIEAYINPPIDETRRESARELLLDLDYTHEQIDTILRGDATPARLQGADDE